MPSTSSPPAEHLAALKHGDRRRSLLQRLRRLVVGVAWVAMVVLVVMWGVVFYTGDHWWLATIGLFAPRWLWLLPSAALLLPAALTGWRCLLPVSMAGLFAILGPMGLCLPDLFGPRAETETVRFLTCNVEGQVADGTRLKKMIEASDAEIVALQECGWQDDYLNQRVLPNHKHVVRSGPLVIASRWPISKQYDIADLKQAGGDGAPCLLVSIRTPTGELAVCNVHLNTPRPGLAAVLNDQTIIDPAEKDTLNFYINLRREQSKRLKDRLLQLKMPLVVLGDFNMPVESVIYRDFWASFSNAFSEVGWGFGYTKITPVRGLQFGTRIDHVLLSKNLTAAEARVAEDVGSDHLPLIADIVFVEGSDSDPPVKRRGIE